MSLAKEVLSRSIQARSERRETRAGEEKEQRARSGAAARQDWRDIRRDMPDAGPHGRATEMARRGYNRARQAGIERGRRTMAEERAGSMERATDRLNRQRAIRKARHEREDKSAGLRRAGLSKPTIMRQSPLGRLGNRMQQTKIKAAIKAKTEVKIKAKTKKETKSKKKSSKGKKGE